MKIAIVMCPLFNFDEPPLASAYISGYLKKKGYEVRCFDFSIRFAQSLPEKDKQILLAPEGLPTEWYSNFDKWREKLDIVAFVTQWAKEILETNPQLVGFSIYSANKCISTMLANEIHKQRSDCIIVFGGPSCTDEKLINEAHIDYLVYGEGEETIAELARKLAAGEPTDECQGLVFKKEGAIWKTPSRPSIKNIDSIPFPDFEGFQFDDATRYPSRQLSMFTSRGCIHRCTYCYESRQWGKYRFRHAENIVAEMEHYIDKWKPAYLFFRDSLINGNLKEFGKMCDLIIEKKIAVLWGGMACVRPLMDREFLQKAYNAGCRSLLFGVESGSQRVKDHMKKNVNIEVEERVIRDCAEVGIHVGAFIIVGYINETEEDFQATLDYIRRNYNYLGSIYPGMGLNIFPGSELYDRREELGLTLPNQDGIKWYTKDRKNTWQIREDRQKRLGDFLSKLPPKVKPVVQTSPLLKHQSKLFLRRALNRVFRYCRKVA